MDFFSAFSVLMAGGMLAAAFLRQRIVDPVAYHKARKWFFAALILYYPVSELFGVGMYLSFVARPVGFVLGLLSFRFLCLAVLAPQIAGRSGGTDQAGASVKPAS